MEGNGEREGVEWKGVEGREWHGMEGNEMQGNGVSGRERKGMEWNEVSGREWEACKLPRPNPYGLGNGCC